MSLYKMAKGILHELEMTRNKLFLGVDPGEKKISWVAWEKVLASKCKGGLGVSSYFALNRALLIKWVWRLFSQDGSLWSQVIHAIYGASFEENPYKSNTCRNSILREVRYLSHKGFNFMSHSKIRVGNGNSTRFWLDPWLSDQTLSKKFPRIFALENDKTASVAFKRGAPSLKESFRRQVRGGIESQQWFELLALYSSVFFLLQQTIGFVI
nr:RNA-directed DNA polymerase, eukaryota [Tanacetum cinerariifolium]